MPRCVEFIIECRPESRDGQPHRFAKAPRVTLRRLNIRHAGPADAEPSYASIAKKQIPSFKYTFHGRLSLFGAQGTHARFVYCVWAKSAHQTGKGGLDGNKAAGTLAETTPDTIAMNTLLATNCPADAWHSRAGIGTLALRPMSGHAICLLSGGRT